MLFSFFTLLTDLQRLKFFLLLVEHRGDLGANQRQALLDMLNDDHVKGAA